MEVNVKKKIKIVRIFLKKGINFVKSCDWKCYKKKINKLEEHSCCSEDLRYSDLQVGC